MIKTIIIFSIHLYRRIWYPIYEGMSDAGINTKLCIFEPTCSEYSMQALNKYPLAVALRKSFVRISKCRSGRKGGYDPP